MQNAGSLSTAVEWQGGDSILGVHAMGIWMDGSEGSIVHAAHLSSDRSLLLVADDRCGQKRPEAALEAARSG